MKKMNSFKTAQKLTQWNFYLSIGIPIFFLFFFAANLLWSSSHFKNINDFKNSKFTAGSKVLLDVGEIQRIFSEKNQNLIISKTSINGIVQYGVNTLPGLIINTYFFSKLFFYIYFSFVLKRAFQIDPNYFSNLSYRFITKIGALLIWYGLIEIIFELAIDYFTRLTLLENGLKPFENYDLNVVFTFKNPIFIGLLILGLSQIFKRGLELQQESDLTV